MSCRQVFCYACRIHCIDCYRCCGACLVGFRDEYLCNGCAMSCTGIITTVVSLIVGGMLMLMANNSAKYWGGAGTMIFGAAVLLAVIIFGIVKWIELCAHNNREMYEREFTPDETVQAQRESDMTMESLQEFGLAPKFQDPPVDGAHIAIPIEYEGDKNGPADGALPAESLTDTVARPSVYPIVMYDDPFEKSQ